MTTSHIGVSIHCAVVGYWYHRTEPRGHGSQRPYHDSSVQDLLTISVRSRGQQEAASHTTLPDYDPSCYLCPGNKRAQGDTNPKYDSTFVFVNDYSAVKEEQAEYNPDGKDGGRP